MAEPSATPVGDSGSVSEDAAVQPISVEKGVVKSGFMEKRGSLVKNWKRRFFQLKENRLEYRRKPEHRVPAGMVYLLGSACSVQGEPGVDICFLEIVSPRSARRLLIRGSFELMASWREAVQARIDALAPRLPGTKYINPAAGGDMSDGGVSPDEDSLLVNPASSLRHSLAPASRHASCASQYSNGMPGTNVAAPGDAGAGVSIGTQRFSTARLREGWLQKKGVRNQSWRNRWFVLRYGKLEYYKSPADTAPQGVILLSGGTSELEEAAGAEGLEGGAEPEMATLQVSAPVQCRVYLLRGDRQTLEGWLADIHPRHADPRPLLKDDAFSTAAPSDLALAIPPPSADVSARNSRLGDLVRKVAAGPKLCKMFCKGAKCKYCDYRLWAANGQAIDGLYSSWVTDKILATSRPTDAAVDNCDALEKMVASGVRTVLNLQQQGEHEFCGPGLPWDGWSYNHDRFEERGIRVLHFGWVDFGVPTMDAAFSMTRLFSEALDEGKVAVHCHAGLGRTGMLIACQVVRDMLYTGDEAISLVRLRRHGSIQTGEQVQFVRTFAAEVARANTMFYARRDGSSRPSLAEAISRQATVTHGRLSEQCSHTPRILHLLAARAKALLPAGVDDLLAFGLRGLRGELREDAWPAFEQSVVCGLQDAANRGDWGPLQDCMSCGLLLHLALGWLRGDVSDAAVAPGELRAIAACASTGDHLAVELRHRPVVETMLAVVRCLPASMLCSTAGQALMLRIAAALLQVAPPAADRLTAEALSGHVAAVDALVGGGIMPVSEGRGPAEDEAGAPGADSPPPGEIEFDRTGSISFKNSDTDNSPLSAEIDVVTAEGVIQLAAHLTVLAVLTTSPPVAAAPAPVSRADSLNESLHIDVTGIEEAAGPDGTMSSSSSSEAESDGEAAAPSATLGEAAAPVIPVGEAAAPVVTVEEVR